MIGRRGFLQSIGAAVLGLSIALKAPEAVSSVGTSIRFVKCWDAVSCDMVTRFDVFVGMPAQIPKHVEAVHVWTLDEWNRIGAKFPKNAQLGWRHE